MKRVKILLIALILVIGGTFLGSAYAVDTRSLSAQKERPFTPAEYQYWVSSGSDDTIPGKYTVVKIYDNTDTEYARPIYCLRGGVGFGGEGEDVSLDPVNYTEIGEMHTNANAIIEDYKKYEIDLGRTENINGTDVNIYNAILWILDESYLPINKTNDLGTIVYNEEEYKEYLLKKAGIPVAQHEAITKDDIEVVQQLAIWYFTNYDEQKSGEELTVSQSTSVPSNFLKIDGNGYIDNTRANNVDKLYNYLINGAIENASNYTIKDATTGERIKTIEKIEFDKTNPLEMNEVKVGTAGVNDYYEIGPVVIKGNPSDREEISASDIKFYDAKGTLIQEKITIPTGTHTIYKFVNSSGDEVTNLVKGEEYTIRFYKLFEKGSTLPVDEEQKYDVSDVTLKVSYSYYSSIAQFLSAEGKTQAVVEIDKEKIEGTDEITTVKPKEFDLSLRKFITKIMRGGANVSIPDRTPQIDTNTLINGITDRDGSKEYTATYTHPKNIIPVQTGDKVIYTIRIYNEGELDGTATQITDYLPEGLELVPASESTINTLYNWVVSADGKTITTDYLKDASIKAFDKDKTIEETGWQKATTGQGGLYYADVQVECKVVAEIGTEDKSLRNIAAITEDTGDDRDSIPGDPGRDDYAPPADNSIYKEDDDDYEDLVLKTKEFDLSLRKFITKVERNGAELSSIASRVPVIEIKNLKNGTADTAKYIHPKNKLTLKRGDIIYYTIRVYNEGELDGYATEIKDYLPEGLELVEGQNNIWTVNGNTLITNYLAESELPAYDKGLIEAPTVSNVEPQLGWQKASDDETGLYYYDLKVVCKIKDDVVDGTTLTNIAEISADKSEPIDKNDRDSEPNNFPDDKKNNNYEGNGENNGYFPGQEDDDDFERVTVEANEVFDLALRKYIVAINNSNLQDDESRIPNIDKNPLLGAETTADYNHKKDPVVVETGDIVTYRLATYNEGDIDGYVYEIIDYLPEHLEFIPTEEFVECEEYSSLSDDEIYNLFIGKTIKYTYEFDSQTRKLTISSYIPEFYATGGINILWELEAYTGGETLDSKYLDIKLKVSEDFVPQKDTYLTNVATMLYGTVVFPSDENYPDRDSNGTTFTVPSQEQLVSENKTAYKGKETNKDDLTDKTYHYEGQQDDDDFEKLVVKGKKFDLSLRKYITSIKRNGEEVAFDDRTPTIDTTTLINGTFNRDGHLEHTATYNHSKEPLVVKKGDIITYTIRIYNEGERDGYATEITDYIPEGLAFINYYNTNVDNLWRLQADIENSQTMNLIGEDGFYKTADDAENFKVEDFVGITDLSEVQLVTGKVSITTNQLDDELIKAFDKDKVAEEAGWQKAETGDGGLYYKDVQVSCLVVAENTYKGTITNVAEISEDKDENGNNVIDDDSVPNDKKDPYTTWQQDDDDYEPVVLKYFDLALRKFITGVETNGKVTDVTSRIPNPVMGEDGNIVYEHSKEPVYVANNDTVIYTLRVYNEGTLAGYAEEITDDIPEGLIYLPNHDINKQYEWKMVDKDGNATENLEEATQIKTEYLSKAKETAERDNLIDAFDSSKAISKELPLNPDYKEVKVAFKVIEPSTSDRIIINSAQISEDSNDDEDSDPGKWNDGEDDQDKEYIYVKYFDLSLLKWVTKTIVTVDGKTTTTETGFEPNTGKTETTGIRGNDENEPVAKVELDKKKLNKTTVKFAYKIRVTNEGEIAGYATEITDYIPEGLEFNAEDNKAYGWVKKGEDKVTTRALETKLLQPGESAELDIIFTWKNDKNNLGIKTNVAEISEDYNDHNSKDIDSTTDNKKDPYDKEQEDDDDFALVILSLKTGKGMSYTLLIMTVVSMLAGGIYLIKRYVLSY